MWQTIIVSRFTGYERDDESGLDYAQARYYAKDLGRFNTVDPVMLSSERIITPQAINLYAYVRNNPLKFVDPLGLDITVVDKTKDGNGDDDYKGIVNGRNGAKFAVDYDSKNKLVIVDDKGVDLGKKEIAALGKSLGGKGNEKELALFTAITDDKNHATVNLVRDDANIFVGVHDGKGQNTIDLGDVSKVPAGVDKNGISQYDFVAHETLESYFSASRNKGQTDAHVWTNQFHPGLAVPALTTGQNNVGGNVTKWIGWFGIAGRTDVAERAVFVLVNPVPVGTYRPSLTGVNVESLSTVPINSVPKPKK